MSHSQHQQFSHSAQNYDPKFVDITQNENDQYFSSSDEDSDYEEVIPQTKSSGQNNQAQKGSGHKVYHDNQYTKLDQKMCLSKMQACENQEMIKQKKNKDKVQRATVEQVLDPKTLIILKKLINNGTFTEINGCVSTGKQANVYYAVKESEEGKKQYAVKIYKTSILVFKDRQRYVQGQFRFRRGYCSSNPRKMVKMWAQKELRNLNRIEGILPCPVPLLVKSNVLVMDFIGKDGVPAPKLKEIEKSEEQFSSIYLEMLTMMRLLYQQCKLIHADLSEYNLLFHNNRINMIDVSQSVEKDHPQALNFLTRDIKNINDFFRKKRVKVFSDQQLFQFIVSLDIAKDKEMAVLEELIEHYDGQKISDEAFQKLKIHQNLASIPIDQVEKQLFDSNSQIEHQTITNISLKTPADGVETIKEQKNQQDSSSQNSSDDDSDENGEVKEKKEGGKQKYEGLSKIERKHKVKEEKREKRKDKIPKKEKKKLTKKK